MGSTVKKTVAGHLQVRGAAGNRRWTASYTDRDARDVAPFEHHEVVPRPVVDSPARAIFAAEQSRRRDAQLASAERVQADQIAVALVLASAYGGRRSRLRPRS
jgi:hypothetical protein